MEDKNLDNGVKIVPTDAPVGEVKLESPASVTTPESDGIDYEKEYYALLEKEAKTASDRDNYKQGMLANKGKLPAAEVEDMSDLDALIEKKVQDTLLRTKEVQLQQSKEDLIKKVLAENKEMKLAMSNRGGISTVTPGSSVAKPDVEIQQWTPEQLAYFEKRGLNPDKVKQNYSKFKAKV